VHPRQYGAARPEHRLIEEIDAMSARPTVITELDSSHSPFLSQPGALADFIASLELDS
jgi:hypothetical protein